jgi:hypothetical protein
VGEESEEPGWWLASDGRWYPPEDADQRDSGPTSRWRRPSFLPLALGAVAILTLLAIAVTLASAGTSKKQVVHTPSPAAANLVPGTTAVATSDVTVSSIPPLPTTIVPLPTLPPLPPAAATSPPRTTPRAPAPTSPPRTAPVGRIVRAGAFCSPDGARGTTDRGTPMVCTTSAKDQRDRWRSG